MREKLRLLHLIISGLVLIGLPQIATADSFAEADICARDHVRRFASITCEPLDQVVEAAFKACKNLYAQSALEFAPRPPANASPAVVDKWLRVQSDYIEVRFKEFQDEGQVLAFEWRSKAGICAPHAK